MRGTGGELVVETLKAAGVTTVFGIISVHNIPIYDAMLRLGGIRPITVRHEQAAVGMADGYARATGEVGVAITSTGPGAANSMGAMVEAYWAGSPVVQITGNIESQHLGKEKGFLHETKDQLLMLGSATKWSARSKNTEGIPALLSEAIGQAWSGRRRPVALEIPIDQQYFEADATIPRPQLAPARRPDSAAGRRAADILAAAKRPLIWVGGGALASGAGPEVLRLANALGAGVLTSISGRGVIPEDDPCCLGALMLEPAIQELLAAGDVLLALGTRFIGPNTQNWQMRLPPTLIHVDIDGAELGRNYRPTIGVQGDAKAVTADLLAYLDGRGEAEPTWWPRVQAARATGRANQRHNVGPHAAVMDALRAVLPRDAIVVKDATIPAYTWGNRLLEVYEPRTSFYSQSWAIGPGLPLALGAAVARPDRRVVLIAGDGGFLLTAAELSTAAQYGIPVVALIFNDHGYGILRNIQDSMFEGRHIAVDLQPVDFVGLAQSMGVPGRAVPTASGFGAALRWALEQPGPTLLDIDMAGIGPMTVPYNGTTRRPVRQP